MWCPLYSLLACSSVSSTVHSGSPVVSASFSAPITVHKSYDGQHAWFSSVAAVGTSSFLVEMSLGGDGTPCPPPGGKPQNCSMMQYSVNGGRSWQPTQQWSRHSFNEIVPLPDGTFYSLGYGTKKTGSDNTTAEQLSWRGQLLANGSIALTGGTFPTRYHFRNATQDSSSDNTTGFTRWPVVLVHSGSVVRLRSGHLLTTLYGHGSGVYRKWTHRPGVFFVRSRLPDSVNDWDLIGQIDWEPAMGAMSDGPGEPSTARLADGRLMVVFRRDSMTPYQKSYSADEGRSWSHPEPMVVDGWAQWSVKPRLRVVPAGPAKGALILTGGRPGIYLWASADEGATWSRFNIAQEHNKAAGSDTPLYPSVVSECSNFTCHRASPPATSSYTGVAFDHDGTLLVSYDRLANGWHGPPGPWGQYDALFVTRVTLLITPGLRHRSDGRLPNILQNNV